MVTVRAMSLLVFGVWSLFVWTTRIGNVLRDDDLSSGGKVSGVALALSFTVVGVAALAIWWRSRSRVLTPTEAWVVRVGLAWTVGVWVVKGIGIAVGDHSGAFIAVHTVLAVVSIGLALWVAGSGTLPPRHGPAGHRHPEAHVA